MDYDIVIVGGGMVGAALACGLHNSSLRVALIDATPLANPDDPRLIALNHNSYCLLKNLGIWPSLSSHAAAIHEVHVSTRNRFGTTRLTATELKLPVLGYVVPAKFINAGLYSSLVKLNHIDCFRPAKLTGLTQDANLATLTLEIASTQKTITAKKVIAADGTHSTVRSLLNIPTEIIDYQQKALVTITQLQRSHQGIAYERFLTTGAIAMLPLADDKVATIWSDASETISELMQLSADEFLSRLQQQFGYRLGRLQKIYERHVFPLQFIKTKEQIKQHVLLIGNAAHTVHPIAAQGLNLALYEVALLIDNIQSGADNIFAMTNLPSMNLSHRLTQVFSADFFIFNTLRQLGMIGLDVCTIAKKRFALQAMAKTGRIPRLLSEL